MRLKAFVLKVPLSIAFIFAFVIVGNAQQIMEYKTTQNPWAESLGNHRAVLQIDQPADAVFLNLPWRRHDRHPEGKKFVIIHAASGDTVQNIHRIQVSNEVCEVAFGPVVQSGIYHFYYLPFQPQDGHGFYSKNYFKKETEPNENWVSRNQLGKPNKVKKLLRANCTRIESRTAFDSFYPMEVIAFESEKEQYRKKYLQEFQLFAEDRKFPVRMQDNIPQRWLDVAQPATFSGITAKNEYYVFQVALWASEKDIDDVTFEFGDLVGNASKIPAGAFTCFNTHGVDPSGNDFIKKVSVVKGKVQAFWIGVDISQDIDSGEYIGKIMVKTGNSASKSIDLKIKVINEMLADRGDSEPWRHSRLRWLNSRAGIDDEAVLPYKPIKSMGDNIFDLSGKLLALNDAALPESIRVYGNEILANPIAFIVETGSKQEIFSSAADIQVIKNASGIVSASWRQSSGNIELEAIGKVESDGWINYEYKVKAKNDIEVEDIRLEIPFRKEIATYMMGMGLPGQNAPDFHEAKWEGPQDSFWVGNVKGGLHCELRGATYSGPLLNLYKPAPPPSWNNEGKGGFKIRTDQDETKAIVYSGGRSLKAGEEIEFEFSLIMTPVKKLDTKGQFTNRYYHNGGDPWPKQGELEAGVKIINVHHANKFNPHINYPFIAVDEMRGFVDHWHKEGMKVKMYYTIRELTNHVTEVWALRSLGDEVLGDGRDGGYPWLREHFVDHYRPQWYDHIDSVTIDASVLTSTGESRWFNYYIEGLKWLVQNMDIDGLYLDDVSFDRNMLKRMRKVMDEVKPGCIIDLHSNTGFSKGPAIQYTDYFPYLDKLWFGESFQYDKMPPENWLVEVSGIPFGHMGDMLHGGGNPWRGMVYGMTVRHPWVTEGVTCDPRSIWKIWDRFGIAEAKMVGYWEDHPIVETNDPKVKATTYVKDGKLLISVASWADSPVNVKLAIDWEAVGLDKSQVQLIAPNIENFQLQTTFEVDDNIPIDPMKGWLIIVQNK